MVTGQRLNQPTDSRRTTRGGTSPSSTDHLHACRGSFATRLRLDGATTSEIADILGWTEDRVERLLALYVDTDTVVMAFAERIRAKSAARRDS